MPWIVIGGLIALVSLIVVAALRYDARRRELFREAWRAFASSRGFDWIPATGPWYRRTSDAILGTVQGVGVRLDTYVVSTGKSQITYTRVACPLERSFEGKLVVSPRCFFTGIAERLGWKSIRTGDRTFDERMVLRSKAPDASLRIVDETVRSRMGSLERRASLQVAGREAKVWWRGSESNPSVLDEATSLVAAVARASARS